MERNTAARSRTHIAILRMSSKEEAKTSEAFSRNPRVKHEAVFGPQRIKRIIGTTGGR
jgi:hypothetical protein